MEAGLIADDGLVEELDRWKGWTQLRSLHALRKGELAQELRRAAAAAEAAEAAAPQAASYIARLLATDPRLVCGGAIPAAPAAAPPWTAARREERGASSSGGASTRSEAAIELVSGSGVSGGAAAASAAPDSLEELYSLVGTYTYAFICIHICIQYGHSDCGCTYHGSVCWWAHSTDQGGGSPRP